MNTDAVTGEGIAIDEAISGGKNFSLRTTRKSPQLASQRLQNFYATGGLRDYTLEVTSAPCSTHSPVTSCKRITRETQLA
jgi:hypothetical protein